MAVIIPSYLGYGHAGRRFTPPEATLKRDIPPDSTLIFDVELISVVLGTEGVAHTIPAIEERPVVTCCFSNGGSF